ncbi:HAD family hydrolase [Umezawaea sp. Da 62-37]|uniref:HAD family hydrolase n=1 Tax=Umezawaea sp. Da 62-37 TaxID=3075927 RepID=UPI0037DCF5D7
MLDLDGVLRRFGPDDAIEDAHGLPRGALARAGFAPDLIGPAITGAVPDEVWRASVADRLALDVDRAVAEAAVASWSRPGEVVAEAVDLVRLARRRCRVALLTNATSRLPDDLRLLGLDREVDAVVSSARIGVAKPSPEAFRRALRVLQHSPAATVFCDDKAENASGARAIGVDGVHTPTTASLREALEARGLLDGPAGASTTDVADEVLLVLPERDAAEGLAARLAADGWTPAAVHRELLAGEDDGEAADWIVELTTAPDGRPASTRRTWLDALADEHDGFTSDNG